MLAFDGDGKMEMFNDPQASSTSQGRDFEPLRAMMLLNVLRKASPLDRGVRSNFVYSSRDTINVGL